MDDFGVPGVDLEEPGSDFFEFLDDFGVLGVDVEGPGNDFWGFLVSGNFQNF